MTVLCILIFTALDSRTDHIILHEFNLLVQDIIITETWNHPELIFDAIFCNTGSEITDEIRLSHDCTLPCTSVNFWGTSGVFLCASAFLIRIKILQPCTDKWNQVDRQHASKFIRNQNFLVPTIFWIHGRIAFLKHWIQKHRPIMFHNSVLRRIFRTWREWLEKRTQWGASKFVKPFTRYYYNGQIAKYGRSRHWGGEKYLLKRVAGRVTWKT